MCVCIYVCVFWFGFRQLWHVTLYSLSESPSPPPSLSPLPLPPASSSSSASTSAAASLPAVELSVLYFRLAAESCILRRGLQDEARWGDSALLLPAALFYAKVKRQFCCSTYTCITHLQTHSLLSPFPCPPSPPSTLLQIARCDAFTLPFAVLSAPEILQFYW